MGFDYREEKKLEYSLESLTFWNRLNRSSKVRGMSKIGFIIRKLKNHILALWAFNCPLNSLRVLFHKWRGVNIGKNVFIGLHCTLDNAWPEYIYLEDNCSLNGDVYILTHSTSIKGLGDNFESSVKSVIIKEKAWIGIRSTILPGVIIGEEAIVSAGCVVNKSVEPRMVVATAKNRKIPIF